VAYSAAADSVFVGCRTAHVSAPASDAAYVTYSAAAEAELTSVVGNEGADVAGNIDEGCDAVASTRLKRSLSGSFSDDDLMTQRSSKTSRCSDNHSRRATGNRVKSYIENSDFMNFHFFC